MQLCLQGAQGRGSARWLLPVSKHMTPDDSASLNRSRFVVGVPLRPSPYLRHVESGTVSLSSTGQELAFGLARSLTLDATHLVSAPKAS